MFGQRPAGSLFGGFGQQNQQQQPQQQPTTSLFGQPSVGTSLFGATSNPITTQPSTGLFGATPAQIGNQQQQQQQQQQPSTSLFGQPAAGSTSLFGSTTQPAQQSMAPSLFGSTTQTQPQQTSLFGTSTAAPTTSNLFGNSIATQQQTQPAQGSGLWGSTTQPQQNQQLSSSTSNAPLFTRNTKFNDLPEELRKKFEQMDSHIQGRVLISTDLKQRKLGDEPQKGSEEIRAVHKDLVTSVSHLRTDQAGMQELRARMDQAVQDTIATMRLIDAFKAPTQQTQQHGQLVQAQNTAWLKTYATFPLEFFARVTTQLQERMQWINNSLEQIERKLISEANHVTVTPQSITSTLQAQHASFVALASKAAALDAELQQLKNTYRTLWRAKTGSARDPFDERDRGSLGNGEFGIEGLRIAAA